MTAETGSRPPPRILITGAAGNLGSLLARHLAARGYELRLMYHRKPIAADLAAFPTVTTVGRCTPPRGSARSSPP